MKNILLALALLFAVVPSVQAIHPASVRHHHKVWIPGHWVGSYWTGYYWVKGHWVWRS